MTIASIDKLHADRAAKFVQLGEIDSRLNAEYRSWYNRVLVELQERTKDNALGIQFTGYHGQEMKWGNPCLIFNIETIGKAWPSWDCPGSSRFDPYIEPILQSMKFSTAWGMQGYPGDGGLFMINPDRKRNKFWRHLCSFQHSRIVPIICKLKSGWISRIVASLKELLGEHVTQGSCLPRRSK